MDINKNTTKKEHWRGWYLTVLLVLVVQIVVYYWFTRHWQ